MSVVLPDKQNVAALKASKNLIGPIYAIIKSDRSGRIVSGENRASADSTWPAQIRHFENNFEEELFRIEANTQRQVPEAEQKLRFNHLAEACVNDLHFAPEKVCGFLVEKLKERYTQR